MYFYLRFNSPKKHVSIYLLVIGAYLIGIPICMAIETFLRYSMKCETKLYFFKTNLKIDLQNYQKKA